MNNNSCYTGVIRKVLGGNRARFPLETDAILPKKLNAKWCWGMMEKQLDKETVLVEKVRNILEKIREKGGAEEESADLYVQLGETLNSLIECRRARYGGRGS